MMKRIAVIFLIFLYTASTSGIAINSFYCCGKLKEVYVLKSSNLSKNCKGNKSAPGCCDTKTSFTKVKDNHSPSTELKLPVETASKLFFLFSFDLNYFFSFQQALFSFSFIHAPPLINKQTVYLSVCNFRI